MRGLAEHRDASALRFDSPGHAFPSHHRRTPQLLTATPSAMRPPSNPKPSTSMPPPSTVPRPNHFPDRARVPATTTPLSNPSNPISTLLSSTTIAAHPSPSPTPPLEDLTPRPWTECFDHSTDVSLPSRRAVFRIYDAGLTPSTDLCLLFLHGGGHCALSWGLVADKIRSRCAVLAFDARGHGHSSAEDEQDLSAETQVADAAELVTTFFKLKGRDVPRLVVVGHSMGGAIAVRLAASRRLESVVGLVVIDVVEGTAMSALPYMASWLRARPASFGSVEKAVRYVTKAGHVRNSESARLSVPAQLVRDDGAGRWVWRTNLEQSERYWKGWFQGLSPLFLSVDAAKMLVLASVDRLDKDLMIAQMQGKFQNILIPAAGHTVHEDQPEQTAQVILDYLQRNLFLAPEQDAEGGAIFQQRRPIPPCC